MEFFVKSKRKIQAIDITKQVEEEVKGKGSGVVHVFVPHCTTAVFVNEFEPNICQDYEKLVSLLQHEKWKHDDVDDNAYAHLANALIGNSVCVPVENNELVLGTWQRVILMELDGPRSRRVKCTFVKV
ncbi:YjbQ family protein [Candidatus Micrarchaeota archaeon]|nr:YjbQ family protein [Candidatus Micrarchaeota archaeon]